MKRKGRRAKRFNSHRVYVEWKKDDSRIPFRCWWELPEDNPRYRLMSLVDFKHFYGRQLKRYFEMPFNGEYK